MESWFGVYSNGKLVWEKSLSLFYDNLIDMKRLEEIIEASIKYNRLNMLTGDEFSEEMREFNRNKAFEDGAKWADEHPNLYNDEKYHTVKVSDLDRLYKKLELYEKYKKYFDISCAWVTNVLFSIMRSLRSL